MSTSRAGLSALRGAADWALHRSVALAALLLVLVQIRLDRIMFPAWIGWSDQDYYLQAARAWAHGNLDPSQHHYPPGYALLAAPFVYLTPSQPFLLPDLICSCAALVLFTRVARRMAPDMRHVEAVAALCFLVSAAIGERAARNWVVPWTTTAAAPLLLACLLLALRYSTDSKPRTLAALGAVAGLGAMVRPTDAALLFAVCASMCAGRLLASRPSLAAISWAAFFLTGGVVLGLLPGLAAQLAVHGFSVGDYIGGSAAVGFDWRLIPLRWVTLAVGPRPLFGQGTGMLTVFPWLLPGIAGMMLMAFSPRGQAAWANRLVAITICLYWLLYLSYRDLHTTGLWRFNNVHYFKWTLPFLAFWTVLLARAIIAKTRPRAAIAAIAAATLLFCWRPVFVPEAHGIEMTDGAHAAVPGGLSPIDRAFKLPADGKWRDIYFQPGTLLIAGQSFTGVGYFRLFPAGPGFMLMPLRTLPAGSTTLMMPQGVRVAAQAAWQAGTVRLEFGIPCLVTPKLGDCRPVAEQVREPVGE
jgi:hypothetical protein